MTNHLFDGLMPDNRLGDRTCLIQADGTTLSYDDVASGTARYAAALAAAGVKPGDRVAAQVEKSVEALFLYLGCVRAGAVFLPLNTAYMPAELDYFLRDAEPALVVASPDRREAMQQLAQATGARVETLGADGDGSLPALAASVDASSWTERRADAGRPRRDPLHVRHDRPPEGRDAVAQELCAPTPKHWSKPGASPAPTC